MNSGRFIIKNKNALLAVSSKWGNLVSSSQSKLHITKPRYPLVKPLPLPENLDGISRFEIGHWSPLRTRDINGPSILWHPSNFRYGGWISSVTTDPRVESYDCRGIVSLSSCMQTNVPTPFSSNGKAMHFNMPGGLWEQGNKFTAENMRSVHYLNTARSMSTEVNNTTPENISKKEKFKRFVKEYGSTVIVFHVTISLASLGICYVAVSSGLDIKATLSWIGVSEEFINSKFATGTGTFVAAYAVHKLFSPVRLSITIASVPFIVRYLRRIGFLKTPHRVQ